MVEVPEELGIRYQVGLVSGAIRDVGREGVELQESVPKSVANSMALEVGKS
jgi:hypothetical protein